MAQQQSICSFFGAQVEQNNLPKVLEVPCDACRINFLVQDFVQSIVAEVRYSFQIVDMSLSSCSGLFSRIRPLLPLPLAVDQVGH